MRSLVPDKATTALPSPMPSVVDFILAYRTLPVISSPMLASSVLYSPQYARYSAPALQPDSPFSLLSLKE